ncbi:MAG: pyruvate dehydrogenase complex E1 component subunit beta [Planctomycetota bacterium]|nr:pyruvate dehydrogenase complex E1 component subunit beta [Planctomycetota bacterium]MDA1212121.1 pyruvate dehydrogenase complex E1 component subunit beta [Planctomycetota bacterium]
MSKTLPTTTADQIFGLYRVMQTIRQTEEELARCHQRGLIHGACHTYVGEEAIATGVCAHLDRSDVVFSTHRGHGHALAKGMPPRELIAELFGRSTGCSRGRGGSMHLFSPEIGMMGTSGIVGPCILQACGGGYSSKLLKNGTVGVAFFGDGAVNNGAFHEGLNMASIWKLPVLFICENNQFATEVPFAYSSGNPSVGSRGAAYGLPGFELDGNDVLEIHRVAGEAIARARDGGGPTLIECKTYRTRAHAEGMGDFTYRTREDVASWKERCPIVRLRENSSTVLSTSATELKPRFDAIDAEVADVIREAREFAEASPHPDPASATDFVYAAGPTGSTGGDESRLLSSTDREITFVAATREALDAAMAENPGIFVMGEGIGARGGNFTTTVGLYDKYGPERLCDTPICERGFVGLGCGAAMTGTRPVVDFMFIDFINDAFGEMINQIAKMQYMSSGRLKMPILLRGCGGIGHSAATHHSGLYHSIFSHIPGLRVVMPSTPYDAKGLIAHALRSDDPVLFLEHRELMAIKGPVPETHYEIPFGKARVVQEGTDATVVAISLMVHHAINAAEQLAGEGLSIEIVDPRTVSPLDIETILRSVGKTGRLLVVDEAFGPCSVAAEVAARVADAGFDDLDAPIKRLNGAFTPTPYAPSLEKAIVPQVDDVVRAIRELMKE